jgi:hypothetical protein
MNMSFFPAIWNVYDTSFGGGGLFFLIMYLTLLILVALATESPAPIGVFALLGGLIFIPFMAVAYQPYGYAIALLGIALTVYKVFVYKRGSQI